MNVEHGCSQIGCVPAKSKYRKTNPVPACSGGHVFLRAYSRKIILLTAVVAIHVGALSAHAQVPPPPSISPGTQVNTINIPDISSIFPEAKDPKAVSATLQILVLMTVLTLVPSILVMMTSFPRVIIVLALLRQAVGTPQLPPGQVLLAISLFITMMIMTPTWHKIKADVVEPYMNNQMGQREAMELAGDHIKDFMYRQIEQAGNYEDVYLFLEYAENRKFDVDEKIDLSSIPLTVMIPAFMMSELKTAFIMGFRVYLPFLVIDMVIATILLSMGMMMLPPVLISLPFKLLLFVLADGWHLVVETLLYSFA